MIWITALSLLGCAHDGPAALEEPSAEPPGLEWVSPAEGCDSQPTDYLTIDAVRVAGDILEVDVNHGGGCTEHTYRLCWNGQSAESMPPQVSLTLLHDARGDRCLADLSTTLSFRLDPLDALGTSAVVVRLGEHRATYRPR